jgi:transposase
LFKLPSKTAGRVLIIEQRVELENFRKRGDSHVLRQRCHIILLKSANRKTSDICEIVGIKSENQVNKWVRRYKTVYPVLGIDSLRNVQSKGRKPIFNAVTEAQLIQEVVRAERQKLGNAKAFWKKSWGGRLI